MLALWRLSRCWPEGGASDRVPTLRPGPRFGGLWRRMVHPLLLRVPRGAAGLDRTRRRRADGGRARRRPWRSASLAARACSSCSRHFCWRNRQRPGATSSRTARSWWTVRRSRAVCQYPPVPHAAGRRASRCRSSRSARSAPCSSSRPIGGGLCCCFPSRCRFCCSSATPFRRAAISIPLAPFVVLLAALAIRDIAARWPPRRRVSMMAVADAAGGSRRTDRQHQRCRLLCAGRHAHAGDAARFADMRPMAPRC